jgi:hypothetical protein
MRPIFFITMIVGFLGIAVTDAIAREWKTAAVSVTS